MLKFFRLPFATTGDKTAVPDAVDSNGNVSYSQGYGFDYQRQKTDPAAKNIERDKMNRILFDITTAIAELQSKGGADFITSALNGGTPYSYGQSAIVNYNGAWYISLVAANTALPTDATKWAYLPTPALLQQAAFMSANAGGTVDAITAAFSPAIAALPTAPGTLSVFVRAAGANATTTPTFKADALAAKTIVKGNNLPLVPGDIAGAAHWLELRYDSTLDKWVLQNPARGVTDIALPLAGLPFSTIGAANRLMGATGAIVAGQGGTVSVPAGVSVSLSEEVSAGVTGVLRSFITSAWTSANLAVSSTYYLRAQVQAGVLTFYVQQGTDADAIPASLKGTPGAASLGGFDSTVLDMLVAKVVTGVAGSTPTVTNLANAPLLISKSLAVDNYTRTTGVTGAVSAKRNTALILNWARVPSRYSVRTAYGIVSSAGNPEELSVVYSGSTSDGSGTLTATFSRYTFDPVFGGDWNTASTSFSFSFQTDYTVEA